MFSLCSSVGNSKRTKSRGFHYRGGGGSGNENGHSGITLFRKQSPPLVQSNDRFEFLVVFASGELESRCLGLVNPMRRIRKLAATLPGHLHIGLMNENACLCCGRVFSIAGVMKNNVLYAKLPKEGIYVPFREWEHSYMKSQIQELIYIFRRLGAKRVNITMKRTTKEETETGAGVDLGLAEYGLPVDIGIEGEVASTDANTDSIRVQISFDHGEKAIGGGPNTDNLMRRGGVGGANSHIGGYDIVGAGVSGLGGGESVGFEFGIIGNAVGEWLCHYNPNASFMICQGSGGGAGGGDENMHSEAFHEIEPMTPRYVFDTLLRDSHIHYLSRQYDWMSFVNDRIRGNAKKIQFSFVHKHSLKLNAKAEVRLHKIGVDIGHSKKMSGDADMNFEVEF